jgi:RNA polymerase sigma-70 factor (ECF subfamily)
MTDDRAMVSQVLSGDRMAFRQLIKQNERLVSHMIARLVDHREDREELCQDVFLKVYDKLGEFTFQSKLSTWIATIAYRQGVNHLRKKKLEISDVTEEESFSAHFISDDDIEEKYSDQEINFLIMKWIDQLPVHYRTVITLYHVDSMNYQEIENITGMPEGTVKNYLFRARHLLKEKVKKYLGKEEMI